MKKFYILWVFLCSPVFAMESIEYTETQSWLPKWENMKTYMGFGISCETEIPSHMPMKAAYGVLSMLIGAGEIYTANQIYTYDQSPSYSATNIPAFILRSHGTSTFLHGGWILVDMLTETIMGAIFGKSQESIDYSNAIDKASHLGLQLIAASGLVQIGTDRGMNKFHFLLLTSAAQISEKLIFKDAFKKIIFDQSATPFNRIYHGIVRCTAAIYLAGLTKLIYHPNLMSAVFNHYLLYTGAADTAGGAKDIIFLIGRVWSNLKSPHYESKKILSTSSTSSTKTKTYIPRTFGKKKTYISQPRQKTETRQKTEKKIRQVYPTHLTMPVFSSSENQSISDFPALTDQKDRSSLGIEEPSQESLATVQVSQLTDPHLGEEPYATKAMLPTWFGERQQLLHYGITIESGPYGETILRCGDITKTVKTPLRDEAKISGKKAETIRSMLSIAWENIYNTYSIATIAMHGDLRSPHHYVFQTPCKHKVISALENCKSYSDVSTTRNELINLLNLLNSEERKERKNDITNDQDLGYYFDASKGDGSHAMYSLGRGMGGITLCKPKNGRNPDELTPEQVKDLKMALIRKGLILNSDF